MLQIICCTKVLLCFVLNIKAAVLYCYHWNPNKSENYKMYCWYNVEIYPYCNASLPLKCSQKIYLENYFCIPSDMQNLAVLELNFLRIYCDPKEKKYIQLIKYCSLTYISCVRTFFIHSSILIMRKKSYILLVWWNIS